MKLFPIFAALLTLAILFAACGDDDGGSASPTAEPTTDESPSPSADGSPSPDASPGGSPSPTPEPGDTDVMMDLVEFAIHPGRTSARPGIVTFLVENNGEVDHQFLLIDTDIHHAELPRLDDLAGVDESELDIIGRIDNIEPGGEEELTLEMSTGTYVLICNLQSDSTSHYLQGMYNRFVIADTAAAPDEPTE